MKSKKLVCLGLSAVLLASVAAFAGCNFANTQKPGDDVDADDNKEASVFLTVGVHQNSAEKRLMQTWINAFQKKYPEVSITITKQYSAMSSLIEYKTGGTLPDICWTAGDQHAEYSDPVNMGYFRNLADEEKFEGSAQFYSGFYDELIETTQLYQGEGGRWFVPRDYNRLVVYYNKTIFDAMDIPVPTDDWTWEQFNETCQKLMTKTNDVKCNKAIEWRNWAPLHYTMVKNFGASYVGSDGRFEFDSAEGKACYDWYRNWIRSSAVVGEGGSFSAYSSRSAATPAAAMLVDTYAKLADYAARAETNNWELNVAAFPNFKQEDGGDGYTGVGCSGYAITTTCTDETKLEWAWKFLKWCMSPEGYDTVADIGVLCPALKEMNNSGEWLNYDVGGTVINYNAYVATSSNDLDVNFQSVLPSTTDQGHLVSCALTMWNNAPTTDWNSAISKFKSTYESATGIK